MKEVVSWGAYKFNGDAETVKHEIEGLGEEVRPRDILDYARSHPDSELHKCFTWDDGKAAEKYRLWEARQVVCHLKITYVGDDSEKVYVPVRVFLRNETTGGYKKTEVMVRDMDEHQKLLSLAKAELYAFSRKYRVLAELERVFEAIDSL